MIKKSFYIFRHGETDWNAQGLFQGHTDIPLNAAGFAQANQLRNDLAQFQPQIIFCSDLTRALQTARTANSEYHLPLIVSHQLREINIGELEGVHRDQVKQTLGLEKWQKWVSSHAKDLDFQFPKGESKRDVLIRTLGYLSKVAEHFNYERIAVSTHGGVIKRIMHGIDEQLTDEQVPIKNCCLYEVEYAPHTNSWKFLGLKN